MFWPFKRRCSSQGEVDAKLLDYCRVFHSNMNQLYWLAYVLTADHTNAEECFVNGLERCLDSNHVFCNWAESWARRMIIKNAIRLVSPSYHDCRAELDSPMENRGSEEWLTSVLLALDGFTRFLFVMSVLERYPIQECSVLLNCCPAQAMQAKAKALRHFAASALHATHFEISTTSDVHAQIWRNQ